MTVVRERGEVFLECEGCSDTSDPFDENEFQQMIEAAKADEWKITLIDTAWSHSCPCCKGKSRLDIQRKRLGLA